MLIAGVGGLAVVGLGAGGLSVLGEGSMGDYDAAAAALRTELSDHPELPDIVRAAVLAANGHNTQPWRFRLAAGRIDVLPDLSRRTPAVDPDDHHLFASLGCASANLELAARSAGHRGRLRFDAAGDGAVVLDYEEGPPEVSPLLAAVTRRQSTRADFDGRPVPAADLAALVAAASVPGVDVTLITDRPRMDQLSELVVAGNTAQMQDAAFVRELKSWIRFNPRQAEATGDGLFSATNGNPSLPDWLSGVMFDLVFKPASENAKYVSQMRTSSGIAIFVSEHSDPEHWARAGQSSQLFALAATGLGLKHSFVNQPVEVPAVRGQLATWLGIGDRRPDLVMRFGYGPQTPRSLRRPIADVILDVAALPA